MVFYMQVPGTVCVGEHHRLVSRDRPGAIPATRQLEVFGCPSPRTNETVRDHAEMRQREKRADREATRDYSSDCDCSRAEPQQIPRTSTRKLSTVTPCRELRAERRADPHQ